MMPTTALVDMNPRTQGEHDHGRRDHVHECFIGRRGEGLRPRGAADVALPPGQNERDDERDHRDSRRQTRIGHGLRGAHGIEAFQEQRAAHEDDHEGYQQCGERLRPVEPVRKPIGGGPARKAQPEPRRRQRQEIGPGVQAVDKQHVRPAEGADGDLRHDKRAGDDRCRRSGPFCTNDLGFHDALLSQSDPPTQNKKRPGRAR